MIVANELTDSDRANIAALEALCKQHETLQGSMFLSPKQNFDPKMPCFYMLYHPLKKNELIAFLSIFAPFDDEAEIYAYTAPAYRKRGCFYSLLKRALTDLQSYGIKNILFVHEPNGIDCKFILEKMPTKYQYSEYILTINNSNIPILSMPDSLTLLPASSSDLKGLTILHAAAFKNPLNVSRRFLQNILSLPHIFAKKLIFKGKIIGCCFIIKQENNLSLISIAIHPSYQKKGYANTMLHAVLYELSISYPGLPVSLEVNSENIAALSLYQKIGFQVSSQFDYTYADRNAIFDFLA